MVTNKNNKIKLKTAIFLFFLFFAWKILHQLQLLNGLYNEFIFKSFDIYACT